MAAGHLPPAPLAGGVDGDESNPARPPLLPWFTVHEGRHTHSIWLVEDGVLEVARRARLRHAIRGMARVYDHVTR